jgi:hypothetical protein
MKEYIQEDYLSLMYCSNDLTKYGGSFSDYERICNVPGKNHSFRVWLKQLIKENILIQIDEYSYKIDKAKIREKIKSFKHYNQKHKVHSDIYEGVLRY